MTHAHDALIAELSALCGIVPEYWDIFGSKHETTIATKRGILTAMGIDVDSPDALMREIRARKSKPWTDYCDTVQVRSVNEVPRAFPIYLPIEEGQEPGLTISWYLEPEESSTRRVKPTVLSGSLIPIREERWIDGVRYVKILLEDAGERDIGYYVFRAVCSHRDAIFPGGAKRIAVRSRIILTPDACYLPPLFESRKFWGLSVNLYAIQSKDNWGIGDMRDLSRLLGWVHGLGGAFVGINPLHAIPNSSPFGVSPYAPVSRLYRNVLYIDVERVPDVKESADARGLMESERFRTHLAQLRKNPRIDYEAIATIKERILREAFDDFLEKHYERQTRRGREFRAYVADEGADLRSFSLFLALAAHMRKKRRAFSWREWPEPYRRKDREAIERFERTHAREILFHQYVQWCLDAQLKHLARDIRTRRMAIGLYVDLAVGSTGGGSDAWNFQDVFAHGANVGAPPDDFSPHGQTWGFPPLIPERLREQGYDFFIKTIRKNMKYSGAIRIDHALGLFRMFWIPEGMSPKDGAYVRQPSEDLLRIIALESVRNKTVVVAEDLGTIGENVRETLQRYRMLSYRLLYFERNYPDASFLPPDRYPELALCAVTTHDLPTLYGYWSGRDIDVRRQIGKVPFEAWQKSIAERERDKKLLIAALRSEGLIPEGDPGARWEMMEMTSELCEAIYRYLARTPCRLLLVSLDDVLGALDQQNLPGTVTEYPNWIQKMPLPLEAIMRDSRVHSLVSALSQEGRGA